MKNPRVSGGDSTRAWNSLGSGSTRLFVAPVDPWFKDCKLCAATLGQYSDILLSEGRHSAAERLVHQPADLRQAVSP
jgi:hypothetical protein